MKILSRKLLPVPALLLAMGALSLWSPEAKAQWLVECIAGPGVPCASATDMNRANEQLRQTHSYLTTGQMGGPGGVTALLSGINERLGRVTNANDESIENEDLAARQRMYDERAMAERGSRIPRPSAVNRACVQATTNAGRSGAGRAGRAATRSVNDDAVDRYRDARPQIHALIDIAADKRNLGTCSQADIDELRPGCQGATPGDRPSADIKVSSLFDGGKPEETANLTLDKKGFEIGKQVVTNIVAIPPDKLVNKGQKESQAGILYMIDYDRITSRQATAASALADILGFGIGLDVVLDDDDNSAAAEKIRQAQQAAAPFLEVWGNNKDEYEEMFGEGTFPEAPSERELLRFSVFKHYAGVQTAAEEAGMSQEDRESAMLEIAAISARVNYAILERLEKQNAILAAMLSHEMDPLTSADMATRASSLGNQPAQGADSASGGGSDPTR